MALWCWDPVVSALNERDVQAVAIDLPGHGQDPGPLSDLYGDVARVRAVLDGFNEPVVLVGHSYGGVVITEAGVHPNVARLVYVASFNLDEGESAMSAAITESETGAIDHSGRPDVLAHFHETPDGVSTIDPEGARVLFYNDCAPEVAQRAVSMLGPQPMVTLSQAPRQVAWRFLQSTYAVCAEDNIVHPDLQRILARRRPTRWSSGRLGTHPS